MDMTRRSFLKTSGVLSWGAISANLLTPVIFDQNLFAGNANNNKRLIFIFLRGGADGLNIIIPRGDPEYNATNRPSLFIPDNLAINSGNGFAQFHPSLQPMMEVYNNSALNGQTGPGNVAVIHRVGYANQSRSHFDSQFYWENGSPGNDALSEGLMYRHLDRTIDLTDINNSFVGAGLSSSQLLALTGPKPIPNFTSAANYNLSGGATTAARFLGATPGSPGAPDGRGLLGVYGSAPDKVGKIYRSLVHDTGKLMGATITTLQNAVNQGTYTPENGATYPTNGFGNLLQQAAMLIKRTNVKVLGVNLDGWDTHTAQGQLTGSQPNLIGQVGLAIQALYRDLQSMWSDVMIVTMTEFGRTSEENGSQGTDHAEACVVFAAGGSVKGGVYNCDATTWAPNGVGVSPMFQTAGRYLARRTDFRAIMGEIFTSHFGDATGLLDDIMPGYSTAAAANPSDFQFLNYIRTS